MKYTSIRLRRSMEPNPYPSDVYFHMLKSASGGFHIRSVDGLGMPDINVNMATSVDNRMASYNGSRTQNRQIVITATMYADYANNKSIGDLRDSIYRLAMPRVDIGEYIRVELLKPDGSIYLDTWGHISKVESPQFSKEPLIQITIDCIPVHLRGHTMQLSTSSTNEINLDNVGTAPTSVEMRVVVGAQSQPKVLVLFLNDIQVFRLQVATPFIAGDVIVLDTAPDVRSIKLTRGTGVTSILKYVDLSAKWFTVPPGKSKLSALGNTSPNPFKIESVAMIRQYWGV